MIDRGLITATKAVNITRNAVLADKLVVADGFFERSQGLIGKPAMDGGYGLLLIPCRAIHSFFVRFSFDVIFLDRSFNVVKTICVFKPWKISPIVWKAKAVLELFPGTILKTGTKVGDRVGLI